MKLWALMEEEIVTFFGVWMLLLFISWGSSVVTFIGAGFIALFITSWTLKAYKNLKPRINIPIIKDKSVVITGCDTGFGNSLAEKLYDLGFKVYAGCMQPDGNGALDLKKRCPDMKILKLDVTSDEDTQAAVKNVDEGMQNGERLWAVVNNAGIACIAEIEWQSLEAFRSTYEVNALGVVRVTKAFLPLLRKFKKSRVVIVASLAGRFCPSNYASYSMSKFAAVSFADGLRMEAKKWGVSVHTIEPTLYKTQITDEERLHKNLDKFWSSSSEEIKTSYGDEYYKDFKNNIKTSIGQARPWEKIHEVVEDMVDAVAGAEPKIRYVPASIVRVKAYIIGCLPTKLLDLAMLRNAPKIRPALRA